MRKSKVETGNQKHFVQHVNLKRCGGQVSKISSLTTTTLSRPPSGFKFQCFLILKGKLVARVRQLSFAAKARFQLQLSSCDTFKFLDYQFGFS